VFSACEILYDNALYKFTLHHIKFDKKPFSAYAKSKAKFTVSAGPLIDSLGSILQTPEENIEEFNRFFCISIYPGES